MPIKKKDWAKILKGIGIVGKTMSGLAQIKEYRAQQEAEEQEAKAKADFWAERIKNPLNIETVGGTSMVAPSGKPLGAAVLSGAYDKYQRESDARLLEKYRMLKITPPEWLKARLKPIGQVTAKYVPPKKEKPREPTETEKNILAHLAVQRGTATPEQTIRAKLSPFPGANKKAVKDVVRGEQEKWDRDVRNFVNQDKNNFPRMQELLLSGGQMFVTPEMAPRDPALKEWGKKEQIGYEREKIAITNIFGVRPEMPAPIDPREKKWREKGWVK